jgi:hypothetical protein
MFCLENLMDEGLLLINLKRRITDGSLMENETPWITRAYVSTTSTLPKVSMTMAFFQDTTLRGS